MESEKEMHVNSVVAGLVMLAAVFTTYNTYSSYQEDKMAYTYEADHVALEQTASALVSLRLMQETVAPEATTTDAKATTKTKVELE